MIEKDLPTPEEPFIEARMPVIENRWFDFQGLLLEQGWNGDNILEVRHGYVVGQGAHLGQARKTGKAWQFDHARHVAEALVVEWHSRNPVSINVALLHDTLEDTYVWDPIVREGVIIPYSVKRAFAESLIGRKFGKATARNLGALSRPDVDKIEIFTEEEAKNIAAKQIEEAPDLDVVKTKLEDNINNLEEPINIVMHKAKAEEIERLYLNTYYKRLLTPRHNIKIAERRVERLEELIEGAKKGQLIERV